MRRSHITVAALTTALLTLVPTVVFAGTAPPPEWTRQIGTQRFDIAWGVVTDAGDVWVAGSTDGSLAGPKAGRSDAYVRGYDVAGNEIWTRQIGSNRFDDGFQAAVDSTGSVYLMGNTRGRMPGQKKVGEQDIYIAKYDSGGVRQWVLQFGTRRFDAGINLISDGTDLYLTGTTAGRIGSTPRLGGDDAFMSKLDGDGQEIWTQQFGTRRDDFGYANAITPHGIVMSGHTMGGLAGPNRGGLDAFVRLFDPDDGATIWTHQLGTRKDEYGNGVEADANGVYVGGLTFGRFPGQERRAEGSGYVMQLDTADGSEIWVSQFGRKFAGVFGLAVRAGTVYAVGDTEGKLAGESPGGPVDAFIRAYDDTGAVIWSALHGTPRADTATWVSAAGGYLTLSGFTGGRFPGETKYGEGDGFVSLFALT